MSTPTFTTGFRKVAGGETNKEMVESDLTNIGAKAHTLHKLMDELSSSKDCPPWVVSKITQAKTHIQDVMDFVSGEAEKKGK